MKVKSAWLWSELLMVVLLISMVINWYVVPFPEWVVRGIGVVLLLNIAVLIYSWVRYRKG